MEIYYYIFIIAFLLCFFDFVKHKALGFVFYFSFAIFLVIFVGFRDVGVDNDSIIYEDMFYLYEKSTYQEIWEGGFGYVEKGYVLINKWIATFGGDYTVLFLVMAFLTAFFNYTFFFKKSIYPFLSLLFYLSFYFIYRDFTQIRYALSCAICFWVVWCYIKQNYKLGIILLLLAISFHNAATILIPTLVFIHFVKVEKILMILPLPALLVGKVVNLFPLLVLSGLANEHMKLYLEEEGGSGLVVSIIGYFIMILYYIVNYVSKKKIEIIKEEKVYFQLLSFSVILNFVFIQSAIFQRFTYLLFQFIIMLLPILLRKMSIHFEKKETFLIVYFLVACFLLFYGTNMIDTELVRPYKF